MPVRLSDIPETASPVRLDSIPNADDDPLNYESLRGMSGIDVAKRFRKDINSALVKFSDLLTSPTDEAGKHKPHLFPETRFPETINADTKIPNINVPLETAKGTARGLVKLGIESLTPENIALGVGLGKAIPLAGKIPLGAGRTVGSVATTPWGRNWWARTSQKIVQKLSNYAPESVIIPAERPSVSEAAQAASEGFASMPAQTRRIPPLKTASQIAMEKPTPKGEVPIDVGASHYGIKPETKPPIEYPQGRIPRTRTAEGGFVALPEEDDLTKQGARLVPVFFSKLERAIEERMPNQANRDQVQNIIHSGGVKQAEIQDTGILDFLKSKQRFTKQEVLDYVRSNNVQVEEVVKSNLTGNALEAEKKAVAQRLFGKDFYEISNREQERVLSVISSGTSPGQQGQTKFSQWQLPGGENYRELLLKMPTKNELPSGYFLEQQANGKWGVFGPGPLERNRYGSGATREEAISSFVGHGHTGAFKSVHFAEPNVLAHVRFNDRVDAQGKKVLFIEEVQSDWHQKGRAQGYGIKPNDEAITKWLNESGGPISRKNGQWFFRALGEDKLAVGATSLEEAAKAQRDFAVQSLEGLSRKGVPDAPFKKTWHELAMKRMLRYAAENDYDRIAWTTGEQQAARYDLSKQISKVRYNEKQGNLKAYDLSGEEVINQENVAPAKIEEYIGKEPAKKLIEAEKQVPTIVKSKEQLGFTKDRYLIKVGDTVVDVADGLDHAERLKSNFVDKYGQWQEIGGLDLKVGGEGMKGFYDQMVRSYTKDYTKKWEATAKFQPESFIEAIKKPDGWYVKVSGNAEAGPYPTKEAAQSVHSVDITPSMKRDVLYKGQPRGFLALPEEEEVKKATRQAIAQGLASRIQTPQEQRVEKIVGALREAKPIRGEQEALYTKARGEKMARLQAVRERTANLGGEEAYHAELSQLKGSLPKVQYESIRDKIAKADVSELFYDINRSSLDIWEQVSAKSGLAKVLGVEGFAVPTKREIELLDTVFGPNLTKELLAKRPFLEQLYDEGIALANLPKALKASVDLSAPFRQGAFLVGRQKQFAPAFAKMFNYFGSEKAYKEVLDEITTRPTYKVMKDAGLSITTMGAKLSNREEAFVSKFSNDLPWVKASNRAYSGFLDKVRADVFDDIYGKWKKLGIADDPKSVKQLADYINNATGRGSLGGLERSLGELNALFFSPRFIASRVKLLNPAYYITLKPQVRKEALYDLAMFSSTWASVLGLAAAGGAVVVRDPRSADFMKAKVGNSRFDFGAGFQQYLVLGYRLATGKSLDSTTGREYNLGEGYKATTRYDLALRFAEGKTSPIVSFAIDLMRGKTGGGQPVNKSAELLDMAVPMAVNDIYEMTREHGLSGAWMGAPAIFGIGVQSYGKKIPTQTTTPSGRKTISFQQEPDFSEMLVNKMQGKQVSNIPKEMHPALEQARLAEISRKMEIDKAKKIVLETGKPREVGKTRIYLKDGVVMTKTAGGVDSPNNVYKQLTDGQSIRNRVAERYKTDKVVDALQKAETNEQKIEILKAERGNFKSDASFSAYLNDLRLRYPRLVSREVRARINAR